MWKMHNAKVLCIIIVIIALGLSGTVIPGIAAENPKTSCRMQFNLAGWSIFYQTAKGTGTITCENGQSADVEIDVKGGGITAGKTKIENGIGKFSGVSDISELYGPYVKAEAHAGAEKSSTAQAMTKGDVSLALSGVGEGVHLGIAFGRLTIKRVGGDKK